jgi:hypothetical protein
MQKIMWLILAGGISFYGSQASASTFNDCKNVALADYLAATKSASKIGMRSAANESMACNRFWVGPASGRP